jgi:DNA-binding NarL/FixJ family response regulator
VSPHEPDLFGTVDGLRFEVVLADAGGVEPAVEIAQRGAAGVILVGEHADVADARALLDLGLSGRGYLVESRLRDGAQVVESIKHVARGGSAFDPALVEELAAQRRGEEASPLSRLTPREREVLSAIAAGWSNAAIARSFAISKRAVERHIASIFRKCHVSTAEDESRRVAVTLMFLRSSLAFAPAESLTDEARMLRADARRQVERRVG